MIEHVIIKEAVKKVVSNLENYLNKPIEGKTNNDVNIGKNVGKNIDNSLLNKPIEQLEKTENKRDLGEHINTLADKSSSLEDKMKSLNYLADNVDLNNPNAFDNMPENVRNAVKERIRTKYSGETGEDGWKNVPRENGTWTGEQGNSKFIPDRDYIPKDKTGHDNPHDKTWGQILDENNIDGIRYEDGEPVFDDYSKFTTKIEKSDITDKIKEEIISDKSERNGLHEILFEKMAKEKGITVEEARQIKESNNLVWHETADGRAQLVPRELHLVNHNGGISILRTLINNNLL